MKSTKTMNLKTFNDFGMKMYITNPKTTVEQCHKIDISWLHKQELIKQTVHPKLKLKSGMYIWLAFDLTNNLSSIRLKYSINNQEYDYQIPLIQTKCSYGGFRYWFKCSPPLLNYTCNKKVRVLYLPTHSNYFACRSCYQLTYKSKNVSRPKRFIHIEKYLNLIDKYETLYNSIGFIARNGVLTKKYKKLLQVKKRIDYYDQFF